MFNIEYYSHVKYYDIASDSIYTCDYVPEQAVSHLSFTRTEKAFASEIRKIEREQAFLSNRKIYRSAEVISAFIASAMISFCIIEEKDISYHSFQQKVKKIRDVAGAMRIGTTWKCKIVKFCYNNGFLYPICVYYCYKQKRSMR